MDPPGKSYGHLRVNICHFGQFWHECTPEMAISRDSLLEFFKNFQKFIFPIKFGENLRKMMFLLHPGKKLWREVSEGGGFHPPMWNRVNKLRRGRPQMVALFYEYGIIVSNITFPSLDFCIKFDSFGKRSKGPTSKSDKFRCYPLYPLYL